MADKRTYQPEWRDEQADSRYPFSDDSNLASSTGLTLDAGTFLDAALYPLGAGSRLYLTRIHSEGRSVTLYIGDNATPDMASVTFDPLAPPETLTLIDQYERPAGILVSDTDRMVAFQTWPYGDHTFSTNAEFCTSVFVPSPGAGVRGILLDDGTLLTGDVWLVGEDGVVIRQDGDNTIRFDLVGDPLFRRRLCQTTDLFATPRFIRTINGRLPDERGDFKFTVNAELAGDTILRVYPDPNANVIRIEVVGQKLEGIQ